MSQKRKKQPPLGLKFAEDVERLIKLAADEQWRTLDLSITPRLTQFSGTIQITEERYYLVNADRVVHLP